MLAYKSTDVLLKPSSFLLFIWFHANSDEFSNKKKLITNNIKLQKNKQILQTNAIIIQTTALTFTVKKSLWQFARNKIKDTLNGLTTYFENIKGRRTSNVADSVINDREWDILRKYIFYFVL